MRVAALGLLIGLVAPACSKEEPKGEQPTLVIAPTISPAAPAPLAEQSRPKTEAFFAWYSSQTKFLATDCQDGVCQAYVDVSPGVTYWIACGEKDGACLLQAPNMELGGSCEYLGAKKLGSWRYASAFKTLCRTENGLNVLSWAFSDSTKYLVFPDAFLQHDPAFAREFNEQKATMQ